MRGERIWRGKKKAKPCNGQNNGKTREKSILQRNQKLQDSKEGDEVGWGKRFRWEKRLRRWSDQLARNDLGESMVEVRLNRRETKQ